MSDTPEASASGTAPDVVEAPALAAPAAAPKKRRQTTPKPAPEPPPSPAPAALMIDSGGIQISIRTF